MDTTFADAVLELGDRVDRAVERAKDEGLTAQEIAKELRIIAKQLEEAQ